MEEKKIKDFQESIIEWYSNNQRIFPWRYTFDPYKVLISEILLQQTNADKVVDAYRTITNKYKSIEELSSAEMLFLEDVFKDLGLFYRAERLKNISSYIKEEYNGVVPDNKEDLMKIKGIGNYICNAVLCFGYNKRFAIVDTNVIRVFERVFSFKSSNKRPHTDKKMWEFAQMILPIDNYIDYNYGLLDFAGLVCKYKKIECEKCLLHSSCKYNKNI